MMYMYVDRAGKQNRFNRYIVECKLSYYLEVANASSGFNRYIVECKSFYLKGTE